MTPTSAKISPAAAPTARRIEIDVALDDAGWSSLDGINIGELVAPLGAAIAEHADIPATATTATVAFSSDGAVRELNKLWRGQDKPTNVLSFPSPARVAAGSTELFLGDVILAEATIVREAIGLGIPLSDHIRHLVVHGVLHLLGFDHETEADAQRMEPLETRILASLSIPDPYAGLDPLPHAPVPAGAAVRKGGKKQA